MKRIFALCATFAGRAALLFCACASTPALAQSALIDWHFETADNDTGAKPQFITQFAAPDFVPGVNGRGWRSDGFSSWVSAPLTLDPQAGFTVQGWVALESYPSGYERPVEDMVPGSILQQASKDAGFDVFIDAYGRWGLRVSTAAGTLRARAKELFPLNVWAHVALTYDPAAGVAQLMLNGKVVATAAGRPGPFKPAVSPFQIAHSWHSAPMGVFDINGLDAAFDDVSVSSTALSVDKIAAGVAAVAVPPARPSLVVPASRFAGDLQRPAYHAMPPANWTNEPHGLIRRGQTWHMFYQRTPNGPYKTLMTWGHLQSDDLVHWTDLPIALRPELQTEDFGFDMKGIWSGHVVTGPGGMAFAFYTSVNHSPAFFNPGISLAISDDPGLLHWQKAGPLIDAKGLRDFRDPYVWFEGGETRMIVGAAFGGEGGGVAYYRCANLGSRTCWKKQPDIAPFAKMDPGSAIWEMPVFAKLSEGKYILEANPVGATISKYGARSTRAMYWIGKWDGAHFTPDSVKPKMLDLVPGHLSPTVDRDASGQLVGIGIVDERRSDAAQLRAGWAHVFSLPRVWRLLPDGETLGQSPLPALAQLRQTAGAIETKVQGSGDLAVGDLGHTAELSVDYTVPPASGGYGVTLAGAPDGSELTRLWYDPVNHEIVLDKQHSTVGKDGEGPQVLRGAYDEKVFGIPRDFHVYIDHSVVDVFINNAATLSFRIYPLGTASTRFGVMSSAPASAKVQAWRLAAAPITVR